MPRANSFDTAGFYQALDAVRQARGLSWYAVWRQTFVDNCTSAKKRERSLPAEDRQTLATWAGLDASAFERKVGQA